MSAPTHTHTHAPCNVYTHMMSGQETDKLTMIKSGKKLEEKSKKKTIFFTTYPFVLILLELWVCTCITNSKINF